MRKVLKIYQSVFYEDVCKVRRQWFLNVRGDERMWLTFFNDRTTPLNYDVVLYGLFT